ncbi:MAG: hypothetical protein HYY03_02060 [Chloroflexi bacterium]|nr:hypothetical protein [Chloroflexota bacterium]
MLILFVLALAVLLGFVAMVIDVGLAFEERRNAQNAADAAALAGAQELGESGSAPAAIAEATEYLAAHGYQSPQASITINIPPASGPSAGDSSYVEVLVSTDKAPVFRAPLTNALWTVSARAVAGAFPQNVPPYNFISLRDDCKNHTLLINAGGTLTVNGGIYVNSCNGADGQGKGALPPGYGDAFDIFGAGGHIEAQAVYVVGGWETHDGATVNPDPLIRQQAIPDPAADLVAPDPATLPVQRGTPTQASQLKIQGNTVTTIQPGIYYGGIKISGNADVTLADGIYYIGGGGFEVTGNATLNAPHVLIYNTNSQGKGFDNIDLDSSSSITMGPMASGPYMGMVIFQDRLNSKDIYIDPGNGIDGLSGTLYAPHDDVMVKVEASGTANMQIVAGMINIVGANTTFQFQSSGLFGTGFKLTE